MRGDIVYLTHILECIQQVELYAQVGQPEFFSSRMAQDAVLRNLQVLAESSQRVSVEVKTQYPGVRWSGIAAFRNVLVHDYLGLDLNEVWSIIQKDIPILKQQIEAVAKELGGSGK